MFMSGEILVCFLLHSFRDLGLFFALSSPFGAHQHKSSGILSPEISQPSDDAAAHPTAL